jgi:hypothetical protein
MSDTPNRSRSKTKRRKTLDTSFPSDEKRTSRSGSFGGFPIRGTSFEIDSRVVGWRITITRQDGDEPYECWVHSGRIYTVKFETAPPWDHQTRFVIGGPAKGIEPSIEAAILQAAKQWSRSPS